MSSEQMEARIREICREEVERLMAETRRDLTRELEDVAARLSAGEFQALLASLAESARPPMVDPRHTHPELIKEIGELHRHLIRAILDLSKKLREEVMTAD